ncbi:MAG: TonB-dependent receptor [Saprospiraceae bacterium]|nr:TonB-dependent receptor [Saprospiraceae bacterium]
MKIHFNFIVLIILLISNFSVLSAQKTKQNIRGEVIDINTQLPLIGATVMILGTDPMIGTATDENGQFVLENIAIGRYDVEVSFLGYNTFIENEVLVNSSDDVMLSIQLSPSTENIGEIIVSSDQRTVINEAAIVSSRSFNVEELSRIPGGVDDPARMARKFPGISPNSQITFNGINVRGNASRAVRWRLDEVDIYNPNHYVLLGSSGGTLTIFSQRLLTNTDFYSGAFPADYGNALGGVFDVRFRNGNTKRFQHSIQLSLLGLDIASEGPLNKKKTASFIANYRLSSTWLLDLFLNFGDIPVFQDLSFKFHMKLPKNGSLNVFGIGGISSLTFVPVLDTTVWAERPGSNYGRSFRNITGTLGLSYVQPHNGSTYSKHVLVGTGINIGQNRYYQDRDLITKDTTTINTDNDYRITYSGYINHKFSEKHTHRSGIILNGMYANLKYMQAGEADNENMPVVIDDTIRYGQGMSLLAQAYSRSQIYLGKWQFNLGIHAMYLLYSNELSIEPRLGIRYQPHPKHILSLGYGIHSQMDPFFAYVSNQYDSLGGVYRQMNKDLKFNKAHHFVLAYQARILEKLHFGIELYYQRHYNVVVGVHHPIARIGGYDYRFESFDLNNGGTGNNYGVELILEKVFDRGYYILFNTSIFEANYKANDGVLRPSTFNSRVIVNLVGGKEWQIGKRKASFLGLNLSATYSGAQYYTPLDLQTSIERGMYMSDYTQPNGRKQSPLLFLDFSLVYKLNGKKTNSQFTLQVNNVLNQKPVTGQFFDKENNAEGLFYGTGIIPVLGWRISF